MINQERQNSSLNSSKLVDGFTFIEVVIAIAILLITLSAVAGLMNISLASSIRAENQSQITDEMSKLADQIRTLPFEDIGDVPTFVSEDGIITMSVTVETNTTDWGNVKVVTIDGSSSRVNPGNHQVMSIVVRNPISEGGVTEGNPTETPPPTLVLAAPTPSSTPIMTGNITLTASVTKVDTASTLTALRFFIDGANIGEVVSPVSGQNYSITWNTNETNTDGSRKYLDGIKNIMVLATDNAGNQPTITKFAILDNVAVTTTVPAQVVSRVGNVLTWNQIPDPAASGSYAQKYKVVVSTNTKKTGTFTVVETGIVQPATYGELAPTTYTIAASLTGKYYKFQIYPGCPSVGSTVCTHNPVWSTSCLTLLSW